MRFFNYGRKSVYSDKSDSIDNQFRMSREYCEQKFPGKIESWQEFSDEDFTGANTSRPDLQRMLSYIEEGFCDVLVEMFVIFQIFTQCWKNIMSCSFQSKKISTQRRRSAAL